MEFQTHGPKTRYAMFYRRSALNVNVYHGDPQKAAMVAETRRLKN